MIDDVLNNLPKFKNKNISEAFFRAYSIVNRYERPLCAISGGADSDIMLDIIWRVDENKRVKYVFFDTGLEYKATKDHLDYLEQRYKGLKIHRVRAKNPIPLVVKKNGQPFVSKIFAEKFNRLQKHNFKWEDKSFEELIKEYPKAKSEIMFWCNKHNEKYLTATNKESETSMYDINRKRYLKEFMLDNHPEFKISAKCCDLSKKATAKQIAKEFDADLNIMGVRKAEGGARASAYKNCYSQTAGKTDQYRPLFWFTNEDKECYEKAFGIVHSDCYTKYGLTRTGCVGCPFALDLKDNLEATKKFEPNLYKACMNIFGESYEYRDKFEKYREEQKAKQKGFYGTLFADEI